MSVTDADILDLLQSERGTGRSGGNGPLPPDEPTQKDTPATDDGTSASGEDVVPEEFQTQPFRKDDAPPVPAEEPLEPEDVPAKKEPEQPTLVAAAEPEKGPSREEQLMAQIEALEEQLGLMGQKLLESGQPTMFGQPIPKAEEKPVTPTEPSQPASIPALFTPEQHFEAIQSAEGFNKVMNDFGQRMLQGVLTHLPQLVNQMVGYTYDWKTAESRFFADNPSFARPQLAPFLQALAREMQAGHPEWNASQLYTELGSEAKRRFRVIQEEKEVISKPIKARPTGATVSRPRATNSTADDIRDIL